MRCLLARDFVRFVLVYVLLDPRYPIMFSQMGTGVIALPAAQRGIPSSRDEAGGFVFRGGNEGGTLGAAGRVGEAIVPEGFTDITKMAVATDTRLPTIRRMLKICFIVFCLMILPRMTNHSTILPIKRISKMAHRVIENSELKSMSWWQLR